MDPDRRFHPFDASRYAAQNHNVSGVRIPCMTVPAVTDVYLPHAEQSDRCRRSSTHACRHPHAPQAYPSGQRDAAKYPRHATLISEPPLKLDDTHRVSRTWHTVTVEPQLDGTGWS
jgi:hypothetical protein